MATPQPTEMQVEGEIGVEEVVKEMLEIEVEEDKGDPFKGMNNTQVAEIYYKMKPEDRRLFRQFKSFHKLHYDLHGHDAPSHHLARGIIQEMFSGLPARDADTIANARAELLTAERLKDLCKQLGLTSYKPTECPQRHWSTRRPLHHCVFLHDRIKQNKWPKSNHNSHLPERTLLRLISNQT